MTTEKRAGRLVGALLLAAMLLGLWNNFGFTAPIFAAPGGYLQNGVLMPFLFGASALLALLTSTMGLTVAIIAWPFLRKGSPGLALALLLLTTIGFATTAVEQAQFLSMQSLSAQYAKHPAVDPALFDILRGMVSADHSWIHFLDRMCSGATLFVLNAALFHSRFLPRFIPLCGMLAALVQISGISLELFSRELPSVMLAPLALTQLMLCVTLLARGFERPAESSITAPADRVSRISSAF